jgi:hypothetical protein
MRDLRVNEPRMVLIALLWGVVGCGADSTSSKTCEGWHQISSEDSTPRGPSGAEVLLLITTEAREPIRWWDGAKGEVSVHDLAATGPLEVGNKCGWTRVPLTGTIQSDDGRLSEPFECLVQFDGEMATCDWDIPSGEFVGTLGREGPLSDYHIGWNKTLGQEATFQGGIHAPIGPGNGTSGVHATEMVEVVAEW